MASRTVDLQAFVEAQLSTTNSAIAPVEGRQGKMIYLPNGIYEMDAGIVGGTRLTDGTFAFRCGLNICGESRDGVKLILADGVAPASKPMAMITANSQNGDNSDKLTGGGNQAFMNKIQNVTLDIGKNNPGAAALDWVGNNSSVIHNVRCVSGDGQGRAGILFTKKYPGPMLVRGNVRIEGFDYAIDIDEFEYSVTFDLVQFVGQNIAGIRNTENVLNIRRLYSNNLGPAIIGSSPTQCGEINIVNSEMVGGSAGRCAIEFEGTINAENIKTTGSAYAGTIKQGGIIRAPVGLIAAYSTFPRTDGGSVDSDGKLPWEDAPHYHNNDLTKWRNLGAGRTDTSSSRDDTSTANNNIASGLPVMYIADTLRLGGTVLITPSVLHLVMTAGRTDVKTGSTFFADANNPKPMFKVVGGDANTPDLIIEGWDAVNYNNQNTAGLILLEHASPRRIILRDSLENGYVGFFYRNQPGCGKIFAENLGTLSPWLFDQPQDLQGLQFNPENHADAFTSYQTIIRKNGGKSKIFGMKTENKCPIWLQTNGGELDIMGGFYYPVAGSKGRPDNSDPNAVGVPDNLAIFDLSATTKARLSFMSQADAGGDFNIHIKDGADTLLRSAAPKQNNKSKVAMYHSAALSARASGGTGLLAEYWNTADFFGGTGFSGTPVGTEYVSKVDFNFGNNKPHTAMDSKDTSSIRYSGQIKAPKAGDYTFYCAADPDSKWEILVDGAVVASLTETINRNGSLTAPVKVTFTANQLKSLVLKFNHNQNATEIHLAYSYAGGVYQIIPASQLFRPV